MVFKLCSQEENLKENAEKFSQYSSYIETFAAKIFAKNPKTKIGIIGMQGTINDSRLNDEGILVIGPNDEVDKPGTKDDAEIVVNLTDDINTIKTVSRRNIHRT